MKNTKNKRLLALSSAALALPGLSNQAAAIPPTETTLSYRYTKYQEPDLHPDKVANEEAGSEPLGTTKRYDIDVHQFAVAGPMGSSFSYSINVQDEVLSGASPWTTQQAQNGTVDVVMSGASIDEHRTDIIGNLGYFYDGGSISATVGMSTEDDYDSVSFGLSTEREFHNKQTVVGAGFSISDDTINPEDTAVLYNRTNPILPGEEATKDTQSFYMSVARVISPSTQLLAGVSYTKKEGYLHDAYKRDDDRPGERSQYTFNFSARQYVKDAKAALHLDYRYYDDTWGVESHTLTASVYKNWERLQFVPYGRYYLQSAAAFYFPFQPTVDGVPVEYNYFTNDARLSDYGAYSFGLKVVLKHKPVDWVAGFEYYTSDQEIAPSRSDNLANPGLIEYTRFTLGLDYRF